MELYLNRIKKNPNTKWVYQVGTRFYTKSWNYSKPILDGRESWEKIIRDRVNLSFGGNRCLSNEFTERTQHNGDKILFERRLDIQTESIGIYPTANIVDWCFIIDEFIDFKNLDFYKDEQNYQPSDKFMNLLKRKINGTHFHNNSLRTPLSIGNPHQVCIIRYNPSEYYCSPSDNSALAA